jgi:hypothetical protein
MWKIVRRVGREREINRQYEFSEFIDYLNIFVSELMNIRGSCSSVSDRFINFSTEEYSTVIFLGTEEYTITVECILFLYSEGAHFEGV